MNKRILGVAIIMIIVLITNWNFNYNRNENEFSKLVLENVEALANGEGSNYKYCYLVTEWGNDYLVINCNTCSYSSVKFWGGDYMCYGEW